VNLATSIKNRIRGFLESRSGKKTRVIFYVIYSCVILVAFLYVRFPGGVIKNYLVSRVAEDRPDVYLAIGAVKPGFPTGLELERLHLIFSGISREGIKAEKLAVQPDLSNIILGKSGLFVNMKAYDGKAEGGLLFGPLFSFSEPVHSRIILDGINLGKCAFLRDVLGRQISGTLKGTLDYRGYGNEIIGGDGNVEVLLSNGSYQLLDSLLGSERLDFTSIELRMRLHEKTLKIGKLNVKGPLVACALTGDVFLNEDIKKSRVDLKGDLETSGEARKKIPIFISGTLGNPQVKFI
jgi:type II secretion system protein N